MHVNDIQIFRSVSLVDIGCREHACKASIRTKMIRFYSWYEIHLSDFAFGKVSLSGVFHYFCLVKIKGIDL